MIHEMKVHTILESILFLKESVLTFIWVEVMSVLFSHPFPTVLTFVIENYIPLPEQLFPEHWVIVPQVFFWLLWVLLQFFCSLLLPRESLIYLFTRNLLICDKMLSFVFEGNLKLISKLIVFFLRKWKIFRIIILEKV